MIVGLNFKPNFLLETFNMKKTNKIPATSLDSLLSKKLTISSANVNSIDLEQLGNLKPRRDEIIQKIIDLRKELEEIGSLISLAISPTKSKVNGIKKKSLERGLTQSLITEILEKHPDGLIVSEITAAVNEDHEYCIPDNRIWRCLSVNSHNRFYGTKTPGEATIWKVHNLTVKAS